MPHPDMLAYNAAIGNRGLGAEPGIAAVDDARGLPPNVKARPGTSKVPNAVAGLEAIAIATG